jgi:hypothetical protein
MALVGQRVGELWWRRKPGWSGVALRGRTAAGDEQLKKEAVRSGGGDNEQARWLGSARVRIARRGKKAHDGLVRVKEAAAAMEALGEEAEEAHGGSTRLGMARRRARLGSGSGGEDNRGGGGGG